MQTLTERFTSVYERIHKAELQCNRLPGSVQLLAVSKKQPTEAIEAAFALGQTHFGENYLQDALTKIATLQHLPLCWHFVGQLQSNKTRPVAEHFDWAHSVDRLKIAQRLSDQRPENFKPLNVCIQVMLENEQNKGGVPPEAVADLVDSIAGLPRLRLRGLMTLPAQKTDYQEQAATFRRLADLQAELVRSGHQLDTLSMGMSGDFEAAISEGATIIRLGTALFGPRK